jgi:hypothetical protein
MPVDGAGQEVNKQLATNAVRWFAEMWGSAEFDCGPQDYEFMVRESIAAIRQRKKLR